MGYDFFDYVNVYHLCGTVDGVQALVSETHARGMKIIFDLAINFSSNIDQWSLESRSWKDNPRRDWYFWLEKCIGRFELAM